MELCVHPVAQLTAQKRALSCVRPSEKRATVTISPPQLPITVSTPMNSDPPVM